MAKVMTALTNEGIAVRIEFLEYIDESLAESRKLFENMNSGFFPPTNSPAPRWVILRHQQTFAHISDFVTRHTMNPMENWMKISAQILVAASFYPLLITLVAIYIISPAHAHPRDAFLAMEMEATIKDAGLPAANVVILKDGAPWQTYAFGHFDVQRTRPNRPDAVYQIGSVTKGLVGTLAAILQSEGRVNLDAPIERPRFVRDRVCTMFDQGITLRHLLTHTAGLPSNPPNRINITVPAGLPSGVDPTISAPYTTEKLYEAACSFRPSSKPGERDLYSNYGFFLAADLLARAAGELSFADAVSRYIARPLGLESLKAGAIMSPSSSPAALMYGADLETSGATIGDERYYPIPYWNFGSSMGGLGVSTDAQDLARLVEVLMGSQKVGRIDDVVRQHLLKLHGFYIEDPETLYRRALGWKASEFGSFGMVYRHNGHNDGHHAFVAFSRQHGAAIIILTNGSHQQMELLGNRLLLKLLLASTEDFSE